MIVGVDPGKDGGICYLNQDALRLEVMPLIEGTRELDVYRLANLLRNDAIKLVVIERVHAIFGASAKSTFEFGQISGEIIGVVAALGHPMLMVPPKTWQKEMFVGVNPIYKTGKKRKVKDVKRMARVAANRWFPNEDFGTRTHDGLIDAALIAKWGERG